MSRNRLLRVILFLAVMILVAVAGWIAGSRITSPAEAAARTAPPTPSPILVPVEERVLTSDIVTRGTARFGLPQSISIVPSALKADAGIMTTLPIENYQVQEGDVIFTISGRPVFILQGEVPVFRDLTPGLKGHDVRQLENALQRMGIETGPVDGVYDAQTSAGVEAWYTGSGWEPFGPTEEQLAHIRDLEHQLATATNNQLGAEAALARSLSEVDAARARVTVTTLLAEANVAARSVFRDNVAANPNSSLQELTSANADLEAATAAVAAARLEGDIAIQTALDNHEAAKREVDIALLEVNQITAQLDQARHQAGIQIPSDEIVFLPGLPVRIDQIDVLIGDVASGPVMTVTNNELAIDSSLPLKEAPLVKPGMVVAIDEPDLGIAATGVVTRVADTPGTFGVDGFHVYFEVKVDETNLTLDGFSLRLTIPVESTGGAVTAVPISALFLATDGTSRVQVENEGTFKFIMVEPGLAADGFVEVTPIDATLVPGQMVVIGFENVP